MNNINYKKLILPNLPYLFIFWFANKIAQSYHVIAGIDTLTRLMAAFVNVGTVMKNPLPSLSPDDLLVGIIGMVAIRLAVYIKGKNAKKYRHGIEYGSARWSA